MLFIITTIITIILGLIILQGVAVFIMKEATTCKEELARVDIIDLFTQDEIKQVVRGTMVPCGYCDTPLASTNPNDICADCWNDRFPNNPFGV